MIEEIRNQSEAFAQEAVDKDFSWKDNQFHWVRHKETKERVFNTVGDLKYDLIEKEIELSKRDRENAELKEIIIELRRKHE